MHLQQFDTKEQMIEHKASQDAFEAFAAGRYGSLKEARQILDIVVAGQAVYVPHLYRGGWVIRGFGFSTERIGVFVTGDAAGSPHLV